MHTMERRSSRVGLGHSYNTTPHPENRGVRHPAHPHLTGEYQMKQNVMLTIASLLSILFMTLHLTSDTVHARVGTAEAGGSTLIAVPILVVWLHGTLVLAERRSGYIIMLVGSLLASGMPVIQVMGAGGVFRGQIAKSSPAFLFVWTLHALGVTGIFSLILSARGLWSLQRGQPR